MAPARRRDRRRGPSLRRRHPGHPDDRASHDYLQQIFDGLPGHGLEVRHVLVHAGQDELARRLGISADWRAPGASQGPPRRR